MARPKRRAPASAAPADTAAPVAVPAAAASTASDGPAATGEGPASLQAPGLVLLLLALVMALTPAIGSPVEEMLQDTLKSMVVSLLALLAAGVLAWGLRRRSGAVRWHAVLWLPIVLMAYALGSMLWSHTYLAGVEAIRWFLFAVLLWLALQSVTRPGFVTLAWGIHAGAVVAALWTALQFWFDLRLFPQGPNPASTFVNRNFLAEFMVCTLPFSAFLLVRARGTAFIALLAFTLAFDGVAILMTGTRSALLALLAVAPVLGWGLWRWRQALGWGRWTRAEAGTAAATLVLTVAVLGSLPTGNPELLRQVPEHGASPISRSLSRGASVTDVQEYTERSFSMRITMWRTTLRMIAAHPVVGVGAGAWEVQAPRFQDPGSQIEVDYYVHNEFLQLLAEYGLIGAAVLLALLGWLVAVALRTLRLPTDDGPLAREAALRGVTLVGLLALLIVSQSGFPWRMASTGALFALALGVLAASEWRLGRTRRRETLALPWNPRVAQAVLAAAAGCGALALYISWQAAEAERLIVRAVKQSMTFARQPDPRSPRSESLRQDLLKSVRRGIEINPHYRKITPMVADELAQMGDWDNARWIWESVVASRPYVVAIHTNIARAHAHKGDLASARAALDKARAVQPDAPAVQSMHLLLMAQSGEEARAAGVARALLRDTPRPSIELLNAAYAIGARTRDWPLALLSLERRIDVVPAQAVEAWLRIGHIHADPAAAPDEARALAAYRAALNAAPEGRREQVLRQIPPAWRARL